MRPSDSTAPGADLYAHRTLLDRIAALESENERLTSRCLEIEQQNTQLVYLQVATSQLHGTFDCQAALTAIRDIVINLIGSEELAIWELDEKAGALPLLDSFGVDRATWNNLPLDAGLVGLAAITGETLVVGRPQPHPLKPKAAERNLTACIPLKIGSRVVGVVGIFALLPQKSALEPLDFELFDLLTSYGAEALVRNHQARASDAPEGGS